MATSTVARWWCAAALCGVLVLAACGGGSSGGSGAGGGGSSSGGTSSGGTSSGGTSSGGGASISLPTPNAQFDYQISGAYTPAASVGIVDRDRSDPPVSGKYNVCYVNAFQTQPDAAEVKWWRDNHGDLLLKKDGAEVVDGEWGEIVLDVSTDAKRAAILEIVGGWIDECARKGFQAVEPDNLNSWERSQGLLTMADDEAMATLLAKRAHADGLAIAQKNTSEMAPDRAKIGFDFAVVEECQPYGDCDAFTAAYGDRWVEIEYPDNGGLKNYQAACAARGGSISIIYRDRQVVVPSDPDYVYQSC